MREVVTPNQAFKFGPDTGDASDVDPRGQHWQTDDLIQSQKLISAEEVFVQPTNSGKRTRAAEDDTTNWAVKKHFAHEDAQQNTNTKPGSHL